jgi:hypothetical protein
MHGLVREVGLIERLLMLMLWMCCLSFAQEEKNELGLSLGAEFVPRAATTSNRKLSFGVVSGGLVVHFQPAGGEDIPSEYGRSDARSLRRPPVLVS